MLLAGRYEVVGELGSGGMGRLLLARSPRGAHVVIKTAHARDDDERLRDEARVGMRLLHTNIVETLDLVEHDGRPALVTAYVPGASIFDLRRRCKLPPAVVCRIGRQIAEALAAIHEAVDEHGRPLMMLHRDVTPGNVLLGYDGAARLIDLGIARSLETRAERTESGAVRGTLRYLAPELFADKGHSAASDLWSLGVVLFEALVGRESTRGAVAAAVAKIVSGKILEVETHEQVDPMVMRSIAQLVRQDPGERPQRARDAAALFAMIEKQLAPGRDVQAEARQAVIGAMGPEPDARRETSEQALARAQEMFFAEARLQTTGVVSDVAAKKPSSTLLLEEEVAAASGAVTVPEIPFGAELPPDELPPGALPRTATPTEAIGEYTKMLRSLEVTDPNDPRANRGSRR